MEKKKGKKKLWIILGCIIFVIAAGGVGYKVHMHYEIEPHVSYNAETMKAEGRTADNVSDVYMIHDISPEGLMKAYEALGVSPQGKVAVKLSTGEAGNPNYLNPDLIKELVQHVDGTIIECNTAYGGSKRAETEMHMQVAEEHGFTKIADVDIMDRDGYMAIPVDGGVHLKENWVGKNLANYDYVLVLSHFKGHPMGGFGGALKNISIGIGSREGKVRIHSAGLSHTPALFNLMALTTNQDDFTDSMAEATKSVSDYEDHGKNITYISVMNHMSVDCDCVSTPAEVDMHDIGILASHDPVALDQACIDLVFEAADGGSLQERILSLNGLNILTHAQEIGLGNRAYHLISLDEQP
ncbi:MAG: DUF362 domain-containing protein [Lachnospiraceae bacterium]|nr:DUF362 domain-containing protein [Lachnospiraceae bacterium]